MKMKAEFKIYKEGTTAYKITILSHPKESFNIKAKIKKYLELGYKVYDMQDNEIKTI